MTDESRSVAKMESCRQTDIGRRATVTVADIRSKLMADILHMIDRPQIYVGNQEHSADMLDIALHCLCRVLAGIDRKDFHKIRSGIVDAQSITVPFSNSFRSAHPGCSPNEVTAYVASEWKKNLEQIAAED